MNMAAVALVMIRKTRRGALGRLMAGAAFCSLSFASHLRRIHVLFVREPLDAELTHLRRKAYSRPLRVYRRLVTYHAHLTRCICKISGVTLYASRVAGKHRRDAIVQPLMAKGAILCSGLVLRARVIEGRGALDHRRLFYVKR